MVFKKSKIKNKFEKQNIGLFNLVEENSAAFSKTIMFCVGFATLFGITWLFMLRYFVDTIVKFVITMTFVSIIAFTIVNFIFANFPFGVMGLIYLIYKAIWYSCVRERIRFAKLIIKVSISGLESLGIGVIVFVFGVVLMQALWCIVCAGAYYQIPKGGLEVLIIFAFFWAIECLGNVVHVTVAHALARWYSRLHLRSGKTAAAFGSELFSPISAKIALTTSLGSIALGSLIIALLKTLQYLFKKSKKSKNPCCKVIGFCCFYCIRKILEMFTTYAMVHVAMFGKSYISSAKDTLKLVQTSGLDAAVNNILVEDIIGMGTFIGGLLTGT